MKGEIMDSFLRQLERNRRDFLTSSACGLGGAALSALLSNDGLLAANADSTLAANPLAIKPPAFAPQAKNCIFLFQAAAPSHLDLYDPKPKLNELDGKPLPASMLEKVRFAFIKKEGAVLMGSPRKWTKHGECGTEFSEFVPNIATHADDILMIRSMYSEQFPNLYRLVWFLK